jgi:hypothetical protein
MQFDAVCGVATATNRRLIPSDVYGVEHLLRLFGESCMLSLASSSLLLSLTACHWLFLAVRIPQLSSGATIVPSDVNFVQQKLLEFLK